MKTLKYFMYVAVDRMITLNPGALQALMSWLEKADAGPGEGFRLEQADKQQFSLRLDIPKGGDRIIRRDTQVVLIVSSDVENDVGDASIDMNSCGIYLKQG